MALNFPQNPAIGTVYTGSNGTSYTYDGVRWRVGSAARTVVKEVSYNIDAGNSRSVFQTVEGSGNATRINALTAGSVSYEIISMTETPVESMSLIFDGNTDDDFVDAGFSFPITFLGSTYTNSTILVASNSYIAFGETAFGFAPYFKDNLDINIESSFYVPRTDWVPDPNLDDGEGSTLDLPLLAVASYDNSVQQVYTLTTGTVGSRTFILRWEGNADYTNNTIHPIVWEARFYEAQPGIIDLLMIEDSRGTSSVNGVANITQWLGGKDPRTAWPLGTGSYEVVQELNLTSLIWDGGTSLVSGTEYDLNLDGGSSNSRYLITDLDGGGA